MTSKPNPACRYGIKCYRKNPDHLRKYSHPKSENEEDEASDSTVQSKVKATEDKEQNVGDRGELKKRSSSTDSEASLKKRRTDDEIPPNSQSDEDKQEKKSECDASEKEECLEESPPPSPEDIKESIKAKYLVEMPEDFYYFWTLCQALNSTNPQGALKCLKLRLVGPYDVLAGKHKKVKKNKFGRQPNFLLHYRFYYDPPEFQTVLASETNDCLHFGYFRDDPAEKPAFVASNSPGSTANKEKFVACGENLFAAVHIHASKLLKSGGTPWEKTEMQKVIKAIEKSASNHKLDLSASTKLMKERSKKVVCPSFHGAGIVVPVDENEIGYRPVPETPGDLKAMFRKIAEAKLEKDRDRYLEELQELITLVQFANDECDYGEGLELGMDLFSFGGSVLHPQISLLLPLAYQLLNRPAFASIITAHLKSRRPVDECVDELAV